MIDKTFLSAVLFVVLTWFSPFAHAGVPGGAAAQQQSAAKVKVAKGTSSFEHLFLLFQNPPRRYTIRPYWFWNDRVEGARLAQQLQMMVDRGVYGACVYPIDGLRTPYLTEEWFKAFGEALAKAEQVGLDLDFIIDFDWPDGEARDPWLLEPVQSRVVKADPAFRMHSLGYLRKEVRGPTELTLEAPDKIEFGVAARSQGDDQIDGDSLTLIESGIDGKRLTWSAPEGDWKVVAFYLMPSEGADGGQVDLMNSKAIQTYTRIALDPYYQRFKNAFGKNISYLVADHEGAYGSRVAWTPELFETFQRMKGYDLRKSLPYLLFEGGRLTPKVRCDYLDVVSETYGKSFFDQIRNWAESRHTRLLGHLVESPLLYNAAIQGNFFGLERRLSLAGADTLSNWEHWPRDFMEAASVAHFDGKGYWVENQGLEGSDSYIDLGTMRTGTYLIGAWGATLLTPFFNYESKKVLYPPDWFYDQPFWKYFRAYADPARRILLMNDGGQKVSNIAILQPLETVWAESQPVFDDRIPYPSGGGKKIAPLTEQDYSALMPLLTFNQWNYDIMDSYYLEQAQLMGNALRLGGDDYRVLILPPLSTVRRSTFQKVQHFYDAGGIVLALGTLPQNSMEYGEGDPDLKAMVAATFGPEAGKTPYSLHQNEAGGRAYFFPGELRETLNWNYWHGSNDVRDVHVPQHVAEILPLLEELAPKDLRVVEGSAEKLIFNHMVRQGIHFYWIINDTDKPRINTLLLSQKGEPQRWQADTGERLPVFSRETEKGTEVRLRLEPGDACYLVFGPSKTNPQTALLASNLDEFNVVSQTADALRLAVKSEARPGANFAEFVREGQRYRGEINIPENLRVFALPDTWQFHPVPSQVEVPYARTLVDADGASGTALAATSLDDSKWPQQWVSNEVDTIRDWWVLGPWASVNHAGFFSELPPEKAIDLEASYEGRAGQALHWQQYSSPAYTVNLALPFQNKGERWGVGYALTYIYSPDRRQAEVCVAAPNFVAWVNGKRTMIQHTHAFYYQPLRAWGLPEKVWLAPGWNSLLLKLENDGGDFRLEFACWVTDVQSPQGSRMAISPTKTLPDPVKLASGYRWYRYRIPPGTVALVPPSTTRATDLFINGQPVQADKGRVVHYTWSPGQPMVAALRLKGTSEIYDGPRFLTGPTPFRLLSWSDTGLENFSGDAAYATDFSLPPEYLKHHVQLDLGEVGVAAEVWVNGRSAGKRFWKPFKFDVTSLLHIGKNHLQVMVTNSEGNKLAVGSGRSNLANIRTNGLLGPVRILPYLDEVVACKRQ